jgi:hypothetical protein
MLAGPMRKDYLSLYARTAMSACSSAPTCSTTRRTSLSVEEFSRNFYRYVSGQPTFN